jgi:hypothetical protein
MNPLITQTDIDTYQRDGVVIIRGLFKDHVDAIRAGIERNILAPMLPKTSTLAKAGVSSMITATGRGSLNSAR